MEVPLNRSYEFGCSVQKSFKNSKEKQKSMSWNEKKVNENNGNNRKPQSINIGNSSGIQSQNSSYQ